MQSFNIIAMHFFVELLSMIMLYLGPYMREPQTSLVKDDAVTNAIKNYGYL